MNAPTSFDVATSVPDWEAVHAQVNAWRGRCLDHLAAAEQAASQTLIVLQAAVSGVQVRLEHLIGARYDALERALRHVEGPAAQHALAALAALRSHDPLRAMLCHGTSVVLLAQDGTWHVSLSLTAFIGGKAEPRSRWLDQHQAELARREVQADAERLVTRLRQVREALGGG